MRSGLSLSKQAGALEKPRKNPVAFSGLPHSIANVNTHVGYLEAQNLHFLESVVRKGSVFSLLKNLDALELQQLNFCNSLISASAQCLDVVASIQSHAWTSRDSLARRSSQVDRGKSHRHDGEVCSFHSPQ